MPKIQGTRKQHAEELLDRLRRGPVIYKSARTIEENEEVKNQVQIWLNTWIIPAVIALVPELKEYRE